MPKSLIRRPIRQFRNALVFVPIAFATGKSVPSPVVYSVGHDGILGTSVDLTFVAPTRAAAEAAEAAALAEIERLRRILSTYDRLSEISRLRTTGIDSVASPELVAVLQRYAEWEQRTRGALSAKTGALTTEWASAERAGKLPSTDRLAQLTAAAGQAGWRVSGAGKPVTTNAGMSLDVNSIAKGFIIGRVVEAARRVAPSVRGGMIDIGGDVYAWGDAPAGSQQPWRIDVADPRKAADNAAPLARLRVHDMAVSSSGSYARGVTISGHHHSHVIDPRTGWPADDVLGATVIAADNATANALATALCVLGATDGFAVVATIPGAEAILVTADGQVHETPGFDAYRALSVVPSTRTDHRFKGHLDATVDVDITPRTWVRRRPYVAVWITDSTGKHVRTLAMWGDRYKYQRDLTTWWALVGGDNAVVDAVSRATRNTGKYLLTWDGTDQRGNDVKAGVYSFWVEVAYQNGPHSAESVRIDCGAPKRTETFGVTQAFAGGKVECSEVP